MVVTEQKENKRIFIVSFIGLLGLIGICILLLYTVFSVIGIKGFMLLFVDIFKYFIAHWFGVTLLLGFIIGILGCLIVLPSEKYECGIFYVGILLISCIILFLLYFTQDCQINPIISGVNYNVTFA